MTILDYCSAVWGFKNYQQIDKVQNRAMRYFLGVHRSTPRNVGRHWLATERIQEMDIYVTAVEKTYPHGRRHAYKMCFQCGLRRFF